MIMKMMPATSRPRPTMFTAIAWPHVRRPCDDSSSPIRGRSALYARTPSIARSRCSRLERRRHLHADARRALGHDREAEAGDEDALVEQPRADSAIATAVSPTMIGTIAASPSSGSKPASREPLAERPRVLAQPRERAPAARRMSSIAAQRAAGDRRRQRVREELRPRALREDVADLLATPRRSRRPRRRAPCRACP